VTTQTYVLCACRKKPDCYCKNWDGKGSTGGPTAWVKENCKNDPETCNYLVEVKKREGVEELPHGEKNNA